MMIHGIGGGGGRCRCSTSRRPPHIERFTSKDNKSLIIVTAILAAGTVILLLI